MIYCPWNFKINNYPSIKNHLNNYKEKLSERPEVKNGRYKWYCMSRYAADYVDLFEKEKLIYPEISSSIHPAFDEEKYYIDKTCFIVTSETINIKYIWALLSSNTLNFIFRLFGSPLGASGFNLSKIFIEQLPIKLFDTQIENELIEISDSIIDINKEYVNEKNLFFNKLINNFELLKISKKLNNYQNLDSKEFLKECKKQNVDISNSLNKENLENIFKSSSSKIIKLENEINKFEIQLNKIVYKLYELNEEEINLIEENLF